MEGRKFLSINVRINGVLAEHIVAERHVNGATVAWIVRDALEARYLRRGIDRAFAKPKGVKRKRKA